VQQARVKPAQRLGFRGWLEQFLASGS